MAASDISLCKALGAVIVDEVDLGVGDEAAPVICVLAEAERAGPRAPPRFA